MSWKITQPLKYLLDKHEIPSLKLHGPHWLWLYMSATTSLGARIVAEIDGSYKLTGQPV